MGGGGGGGFPFVSLRPNYFIFHKIFKDEGQRRGFK